MNPKHTKLNEPRNGIYARAPYNFVPLPEQVVTVCEPPDHDKYQDNTGYIECELMTQAPLYVRGMMTQTSFEEIGDKSFHDLKPEQQQERAKFFMLRDNEPVIPGSSLRGMLRALVEIVGYGKVQPVTSEQMVYRAVGDTTSLGKNYRNRLKPTSVRAGYMVHQGNDWYIRPAKLIEGNALARVVSMDVRERELAPWKNCKNAWMCHAQISRRRGKEMSPLASGISRQTARDFTPIVFVKTGQMQNKRKDFAIGLPDEVAKLIRVADTMVRTYRDQLTAEQRDLLGEMGVLRESQPVFYLLDNDQLVFLGHTMMFRLPYPRTAQDFVPERLRCEADIDLAEALFGYTKSDARPYGKQRAYASRVFVSDAVLDEAGQVNQWLADDTMITPRILSSPKPTTFQHYLVQTDAKEKRNLKHYASATPEETVIRGHKLYWHKGDVAREEIEIESDKINATKSQLTGIKPVRAGVKFTFRVHFENLNDAELGALLWVLGLPDGHCQSLGMGKPLGMGAVKITPMLWLSQRSERYTKLFDNEAWASGITKEPNQARYTDAFENFILERMDAVDKGNVKSFGEVERIRMLLKLLEFPGPDSNWTRYMTIEPENEFKERPVLPDPLNVEPSQDASAPIAPSAQTPPSRVPRTQPARSDAPARPSKPVAAQAQTSLKPQPSEIRLPEVGASFTDKIFSINEKGDVFIQYKNFLTSQVFGYIAAQDREGKQYKIGGPARCEIIDKYKNSKGVWVLKSKPGAKREK